MNNIYSDIVLLVSRYADSKTQNVKMKRICKVMFRQHWKQHYEVCLDYMYHD